MQLIVTIWIGVYLSWTAKPSVAFLMQQGVTENPVHHLVEQDDSRVLLCNNEGKMVLLADVLKYHSPSCGHCPHTTPA